MRLFRIFIEFPALDKWREFLEARQQKDIDAEALRLKATNDRLENKMKSQTK